MKKILPALFIFLIPDVQAQKPAEFIRQYHEHIDPLGKVDTILLVVIQMSSEIRAVINSNMLNYSRSKICSCYSNGKLECLDKNSSNSTSMYDFMPPSNEPKKNMVKTHLNYITFDDENDLSFRVANDSITVIEKRLKDETFMLYTFDSKTKNLLRIENNRSNSTQKFVSHTTFLSYQTVNDILVPKKMAYANDFTDATLEYLSVEFR